MIEDGGETVIVPYHDPQEPGRVARLLAALQNIPDQTSALLRQLQPYMVTLRKREHAEAVRRGLLKELYPGLWQWLGTYDSVRGIVLDGYADPEYFIVSILNVF